MQNWATLCLSGSGPVAIPLPSPLTLSSAGLRVLPCPENEFHPCILLVAFDIIQATPFQQLNLSTLKHHSRVLSLHFSSSTATGHGMDCGITTAARLQSHQFDSPCWTTPACFPTSLTVMVKTRAQCLRGPASHPPPLPFPGSSHHSWACWDHTMLPHLHMSFSWNPSSHTGCLSITPVRKSPHLRKPN